MRCFYHGSSNVIGTCKECGKYLCPTCSSYTKHSGLCPQCRIKELKNANFEAMGFILMPAMLLFFFTLGLISCFIVDNGLDHPEVAIVCLVFIALSIIAILIILKIIGTRKKEIKKFENILKSLSHK